MLSDAGEPPKKGLPKNGFTYSQTISPSLVTSNEATAEELVAEATKAEDEAIDLYHFTSLINRSLDEHGRRSIVEMMWEIIYADGPVTDFESNLMWRAADLLGISPRERIELGQHVSSRRRTEPA